MQPTSPSHARGVAAARVSATPEAPSAGASAAPVTVRLPDGKQATPLFETQPTGAGLARKAAVDVHQCEVDWRSLANRRVRPLSEAYLRQRAEVLREQAAQRRESKGQPGAQDTAYARLAKWAGWLSKFRRVVLAQGQKAAAEIATRQEVPVAALPPAMLHAVSARFEVLDTRARCELDVALGKLLRLPAPLPDDPLETGRLLLRREPALCVALESRDPALTQARITPAERVVVQHLHACDQAIGALDDSGDVPARPGAGAPLAGPRYDAMVWSLHESRQRIAREVGKSLDEDLALWAVASVREQFMAHWASLPQPDLPADRAMVDARVLALRLGGPHPTREPVRNFLAAWVAEAAQHLSPVVPQGLVDAIEGFGSTVEEDLAPTSIFVGEAVDAVLRHFAAEPAGAARQVVLQAICCVLLGVADACGGGRLASGWGDAFIDLVLESDALASGEEPLDAWRWFTGEDVGFLRAQLAGALNAPGDDEPFDVASSPLAEPGSAPSWPRPAPRG